ncbi:MAG: DUF1501 domain-containing protein, partial [Acidobacteriota bacterium]|nr:DUF1501 domain-containing protein [Acidobacteriota bacterium]
MSNDVFRGLSRRHFLRASTSATLAAMASGESRLLADENAKPKLTPKADSMILLWMAGGMAQTETFDPKRYTPYQTGLASNEVLSTFPSIPTVLDGVQLSQGLENIGKILDRGTLIRSHRVGDLGFILHSRH